MIDYTGYGKLFDAIFGWLFVSTLLFVPLGMWKLVEIIIWFWNSIEVTIK